ncbi:hypothetical protein DY000_02060340 [Brassica cretica]|uniref:Uncharacterized protein n=1 Tax=Brassica cretica TaxID=69181 RepID=A0ABQ7AVC5_BRACR|nr:hypothetical protein DY000_02060340 [Brassica cretica]
MEDMDFSRTSIYGITTTSSDLSTETSVDAALQTSIDESTETSIDDTPPETVEKTGESRSRPILLDNPDPGSEPSRGKKRSNTGEAEKAMINLDEDEQESEEDVEIDRQEGNNVDRPTMHRQQG